MCCVCDAAMQPSMSSWSFRCRRCGIWASSLHVGINGPERHRLDEELRETGLSRLRKQNNEIILDRLSLLGLADGGSLLDVGAAHGWFVLAALDRGFNATGIDPDVDMASVPMRMGSTSGVATFRMLSTRTRALTPSASTMCWSTSSTCARLWLPATGICDPAGC